MEYTIIGIIAQLGGLFFYTKDIQASNITICPNKKDYRLEFKPSGHIWLHQIELLISAIDSAQSPLYTYHVMRGSVMLGETITIFISVEKAS